MSLAISGASHYPLENFYLAEIAEIKVLIDSENYSDALAMLSTLPSTVTTDECFKEIALKTGNLSAADKIFNLNLKKQTIKEIEKRAAQCTLI